MNDLVNNEHSQIDARKQEIAMLQMIERAATNKDVDIDKMERLWAMYREMQQSKAEMDYAEAMAKVQGELPEIERRARNLQTSSNYAKLEHICNKLVPIATRHGLSISHGTGKAEKEGEVRTIATVYHTGGHTTAHYVDLPEDNQGIKGTVNKTPVHARKSSLTYGRTILLGLIFNVSTVEVDDDGNAASRKIERISIDQQTVIDDLIRETNSNKVAFLKFLKVDSVELIPAQAYEYAVKALKHKLESKNDHM